MDTVGICMGASQVKVVRLEDADSDNPIIKSVFVSSHEGKVKETLRNILDSPEFKDCKRYAVTGRKFKTLVDLPNVSEPKCTELAYKYVTDGQGDVDAIISAGGETFMVYEMNDRGSIVNVHTGNKCASGTGEFYFQQLKRMGIDIKETEEIARLDDPYDVSGRCSVFCKSDCTHALNKGEDKGRIVAGLSKMMVSRISEQLSKCGGRRAMLAGGTSKNKVMVECLQGVVEELIVPEEAGYFEALGAALWAVKYGAERGTSLFVKDRRSFEFLDPIGNYEDKVKFHSIEKSSPKDGDRCLLGIDVGSTTTKAVLIREEENSLLASIYLRTEGDPVAAARQCYASISEQVGDKDIKIIGLGVTGSGRHIVGLHALTDSVINEIIAHATASVHFDPGVNTIFEIGGQDAKYTYLVNGVPTDYAMNEACAAGTGSFLEESAYETLNVEMEDIADRVLNGSAPPNFSDQCSAFISSDIKTAIQEGIDIDDICGGLIYSVCYNYVNRVKGSRPVGEKVFMQGGVCYNRAVPMAMAALTGKEIIVPPEPGLMGAFGVALVVENNIKIGITEETEFSIDELSSREVVYHKPFICPGTKEDCDRKCEINVLEINGKKYPFGGICDKYYNRGTGSDFDVRELDLVHRREEMAFSEYFYKPENLSPSAKKIGINRALAVNTLLPMFSRFFGELGHEVVLPQKPTLEGRQRQASAFCYPVEISHAYMYDLIFNQETDVIFLPQIKGMPVQGYKDRAVLCPLSQGEPYYLKAVWPELRNQNVFTPVLNFQNGYEYAKEEFIDIGEKLGHSRFQSLEAYRSAVKFQQDFRAACREIGRQTLEKLESDPAKKAIVIFGRSYSALTSVANMGIPHKFASRGELVIPFDMLPLEFESPDPDMYWALGQQIIRGAKFASAHPQLYGVYITNFSCGPDSFLISYFRRISGRKPTLTLELDSHTADAGIDTRIEAFLDVVESYRKLDEEVFSEKKSNYSSARIEHEGGKIIVVDSEGDRYPLDSDRVKVLVPSMGQATTRSFVSTLSYNGISAEACRPPKQYELKTGKSHCTGKECLPLQLTLGSLLNYVNDRQKPGEVVVYFMPRSSGPCRFGQYNIFMKNFIEDNEIENVALLTLSDNNNYGGMGDKFTLRAWQAFIIGDMLGDINSSVRALAENSDKALALFKESKNRIFKALSEKSWGGVKRSLKKEAALLSGIELKQSVKDAPKVSLVGEIYVRSDEFSRQYLVKTLAQRGIVTRVAPTHEWLYYLDFLAQYEKDYITPNFFGRLKTKAIYTVKKHYEKTIKKILSKSNLCEAHLTDVENVIACAEDIISPALTGEAILTIGKAVEDIVDRADGVIAIGPFGCMPHRISEAILSETLIEQKERVSPDEHDVYELLDSLSMLPFLAIETDGNIFSQETESRLEAFCLQVDRLNRHRLGRQGSPSKETLFTPRAVTEKP